jgi:DNA mismatch repair ATPase MutS
MEKFSLKPQGNKSTGDPLEGMNDNDLLDLRRRIDIQLKVEIKHLKLTEELGLNYRKGQVLLDETMRDAACPANQKAQVFNSVKSMLSQIIVEQGIVYSAERLKRFEIAFLKVLEKLPKESQETFFDLYGEFLNDRGV